MLKYIVLSLVIGACYGNPTLRDCAPGGSSVRINKLTVDPHPIRVPGLIQLSLDAEVTRPFTNFDLNVTLIKEIGGAKVTVPCLNNLGTCYYNNACPFLDLLFPDKECPPFMSQCTCPFSNHKLQIQRLVFTIPTLPRDLQPIFNGKFEISFGLVDRATKKTFSCLNIQLEVKAGRYVYLL